MPLVNGTSRADERRPSYGDDDGDVDSDVDGDGDGGGGVGVGGSNYLRYLWQTIMEDQQHSGSSILMCGNEELFGGRNDEASGAGRDSFRVGCLGSPSFCLCVSLHNPKRYVSTCAVRASARMSLAVPRFEFAPGA